MSNGKSIIVDTSRCTGCRGCQVACKQWNGLPASPTTQTGTYQNPPDFNGCTYKVVRFADGRGADGKPYWYFTSDMCRHCVEPPCLAGSSVEGGMIHDEATGAVVYTAKSKDDDFETAQSVCPYNVPRKNEETGAMVKCTMCIDRISNGMVPACVQACPFDAIHVVDGVAVVDKDACKACGKCIAVCPRHLIELVPYEQKHLVQCSSRDKGKDVMAVCSVGCIGCKMCEKVCEFDAVKVVDNIAHIDPSKCTNCGKCAEKCPKKVIL